MFAGKKSAQIREILISESAWEEMTCLFAPSLILLKRWSVALLMGIGFYLILVLLGLSGFTKMAIRIGLRRGSLESEIYLY